MKKSSPIVLISGFKAGTWLMRKVLSSMTGMEYFEPNIIPGEKKYYNPKQLQFVKNHFYSWHLVPTDDVVEILNANSAKTIFVVRNIYDLVVSIYYHFYNDVDADIGRGNSKDLFLRKFSFEDGISLIISGFDEDGVRWNGMVEVLEHYNEIFKASKRCQNIIIQYDELVTNKELVLGKISHFLNQELDSKKIKDISKSTNFTTMKEEAKKNNLGESHFREGKACKNRDKLSYAHKVHLRQIIKLLRADIYANAKSAGCDNIVLENDFDE